MANRPSSPRTDLPFLRRRIKPGRATAAVDAAVPETAVPGTAAPGTNNAPAATSGSLSLRPPASPPAAAQSPAPRLPSSGLNLSRPAATPPVQASLPTAAPASTQARTAPAPPPAARPAGLVLGGKAPASSVSVRAQKLAERRERAKVGDHEVALLFPAPGIRELYELNLQERVLRLTALESAVGTLVVSGSTAMAWESVRQVVGGADADGHTAGTPVMTAGNRPLAGYDGKAALIPLRHVRELRRAIFINRGTSPMGVQISSGAKVAVPPPAHGTQLVLLAHRIGNLLELRAEPVPHSWEDQQIWQEFDFTMTHQAPAPSYRR